MKKTNIYCDYCKKELDKNYIIIKEGIYVGKTRDSTNFTVCNSLEICSGKCLDDYLYNEFKLKEEFNKLK